MNILHNPNHKHIQDLHRLIEKELARIPFPHEPKNLYSPLKYSIASGGKRIRPLLVLLGFELFNKRTVKSLKPAIAIELFHNFTLLHDDIMDQSPIRRGRPTVFKKWNSNTAILSGDVMFVKAIEYMSTCDQRIASQVLKTFLLAAARVCEGQQMDLDFENNKRISIRNYTGMVSLKTAELLAAGLKIGALIGGGTASQAEKLFNIGKNLGIAFQLQDDYLDVFAEERVFGKRIGGDIGSNKKTFLFLKALEVANPQNRKKLLRYFDSKPGTKTGLERKIKIITSIMKELHVDQLALKTINHYYHKAMNEIETMPENNRAKKCLHILAKGLMERIL